MVGGAAAGVGLFVNLQNLITGSQPVHQRLHIKRIRYRPVQAPVSGVQDPLRPGHAALCQHGGRQTVYRRPGRKAQAFTYDQIRGQRSFANRAGLNVMLYVGQEEVNLYSSMNGAQNFMRAAFNGWCKSRGLEPDESLAPNPGNMIWFPEPGDGAEEAE